MDLKVQEERCIPCMLIVAGPSGAGKSTFLSNLASGIVPDEIATKLPADSGCWQEVAARDLPSYLQQRRPDDRSNIALHYDLNNIVRAGIADHLEAQTAGGIAAAKQIVALTIRVPSRRLQTQLTYRWFGGSDELEMRAAMRSAKDLKPLVKDNLNFAERYAWPDWLEAQYTLWDKYLDHLRADGRIAGELDIAPVGDIFAGGCKRWRLIKAHSLTPSI